VGKLEALLDTSEGLERHEGHLLNWYDTRTLAPLLPRYVSTVDSGNLAGALLALAEGLRQLVTTPQSDDQICHGLADTTRLASQLVSRLNETPQHPNEQISALGTVLASIGRELDGSESPTARLDAVAKLAPQLSGTLERLSANQSATPGLSEALWWSRSVESALKGPAVHEDGLARKLEDLSDRALAMVENMNFAFLYDRQRQIFSIGYRLPDAEGPGRLDTSYYDLLASEARLASFVAIAKGDVPRVTGSTSAVC
jgi:cyclic beta-1,2-glucan synthetase